MPHHRPLCARTRSRVGRFRTDQFDGRRAVLADYGVRGVPHLRNPDWAPRCHDTASWTSLGPAAVSGQRRHGGHGAARTGATEGRPLGRASARGRTVGTGCPRAAGVDDDDADRHGETAGSTSRRESPRASGWEEQGEQPAGSVASRAAVPPVLLARCGSGAPLGVVSRQSRRSPLNPPSRQTRTYCLAGLPSRASPRLLSC